MRTTQCPIVDYTTRVQLFYSMLLNKGRVGNIMITKKPIKYFRDFILTKLLLLAIACYIMFCNHTLNLRFGKLKNKICAFLYNLYLLK